MCWSVKRLIDAEAAVAASDVCRPCDEPFKPALQREARTLSQRIGKAERVSRLGQEIDKSLYPGYLVATLNVLVKSHKPRGEMTLRTIRSIPRYIFEGLGRWLSLKLTTRLKTVAPSFT